ncbi:MAG TPA: hypothetical protein VGK78_05305 [Nocardioides sp.]|uniref:hypothetical protein n=1 Tax=Nocardioides sp. TaxID=35761 RepID=UPI002F3F5AA5
MRVVEQPPGSTVTEKSPADWADQTRRILTRDLLTRAAHAQPGEARALEFRALHLNLPLIGEVADRLALTDSRRRGLEHHALEGLHEAIHLFDPFGRADFPEFARPFVERRIRTHLPATNLRLAVHRVALAIAGSRV